MSLRLNSAFTLAIALLWAVIMPCIVSAVPVVVDTAISISDDTDSLVLMHTTRDPDMLLLVTVQYTDKDDSAETVTYGGLPLTLVGKVIHAIGKPRIELWQYVNPPVGEAELVLLSDGNVKAAMSAVALTGVDLSHPVDTIITKSGKSNTGSIVVPSNPGNMVLASSLSLSNGEPDPSIGSTRIWSLEVRDEHWGQGCVKSGAVSVGIGWAFTENKEWVELGASLRHLNEPPNLAPLSSATIAEGEEVTFTVSASDGDGTIPVLKAAPLPKDASFKDNGDGTGDFVFSASQNAAGIYEIFFTASDGELADTEVVTITVYTANVSPVLEDIGPQSIAAGDTLEFTLSASDADGAVPVLSAAPLPPGASFTDHGDGQGTFWFVPNSSQVGSIEVTFVASDGILADSETVQITVLDAALLSFIRVELADGTAVGDTALSTDEEIEVYCRGYSSDSVSLGDVAVLWTIIGEDSIAQSPGAVSASVTLDFRRPGTGRIAASFDLITADTSGILTLVPGLPARIRISPESFTGVLHDTIGFSVTAYDADSNLADAGEIAWSLLGMIGTLDERGELSADVPGMGRIAVATDGSGAVDTTGLIVIQSVLIDQIALGTTSVYPGEQDQTLLAIEVGNYFQEPKTISSLAVRNVSRGNGTAEQVGSNLDSVAIYLDRDLDLELSLWDTLLATPFAGTDNRHISACSLALAPGERAILLVVADIATHPHDGDSLDFSLLPSADLQLLDATPADGPDTVNSHGVCIIDGMVAAQLALTGADQDTLEWADGPVRILTIDIPCNGYLPDTLTMLAVANTGTAGAADLDSLTVYLDEGDGTWDGGSSDHRVAALVNHGAWWSRSALRVPLNTGMTRLFVIATASRFATRGATLELGIPQYGIGVSSGNDGPLDHEVAAEGGLTILSEREMLVSVQPIPGSSIVWGAVSPPLLSLQLVNHSGAPAEIDSLVLTSYAVDPLGATQDELDGQFDSLMVYHDLDGNPMVIGAADTLIAVATVEAGTAVVGTPGLLLPWSNSHIQLTVLAAVSRNLARAGTQVRFGIDQQNHVYCHEPIQVTGTFPAVNPSFATISGFPASAVGVSSVDDLNLTGGRTNSPVFRFRLPGNGYAADTLQSIRLMNLGSLSDGSAVSTLRLWHDVTGNGLTTDDIVCAELTWNGTDWSAGNLRTGVFAGGVEFIVTASITPESFRAGTLFLSVPIGGVTYRSGLNGPDDAAVSADDPVLLLPPDRVTIVTLGDISGAVAPGANNTRILAFALYNGYTVQKELSGLRLHNRSVSGGDDDYRDRLLGLVRLYYGRSSSFSLDENSLAAARSFSDDTLQLDGFTAALPAESLSYLFVTAEIADDAADSDTLIVAAFDAADFSFATPVALNGDLPVQTGRTLVVDGSVASQYEVLAMASRTVRAGDTSQVLVSLRPAHNGDLIDTLQTVALGVSCAPTDLLSVKIWLDRNGDAIWQGTDSLLGPCFYAAGLWTSAYLGLPILESPPYLIITADIAADAASGTVIQTWIPLNGCTYASNNDGPRDSVLASGASLTVYASQLQVSCGQIRSTYSVGETIAVRLNVQNLYGVTVPGLAAEVIPEGTIAAVRLDSCSGTLTLSPGATGELRCYFTSLQTGQVSWRMRAVAPAVSDSSAYIVSSTAIILERAETAVVSLLNSAPASVTQGQRNVFPLTITVSHPDTGASVSPLQLDAVRITVRDASGTGRPANQVFSLMALGVGFSNYAMALPVPADSQVTLTFPSPVIITPGADARLALLVDVDSACEASTFVLSIDGPEAFVVHDANAGSPATVQSAETFPLSTAICRVDLPAGSLAVAGPVQTDRQANQGQTGVVCMDITVRHPGEVGASPIQITSLRAAFVDSDSNPIDASTVLRLLAVRSAGTEYGTVSGAGLSTTPVQIDLGSPLTLGPGEARTLQLIGDVGSSALNSGFRLVIADSSYLSVREIGSGATILAVTDTTVLSTASAFPLAGGWVDINEPALPPSVCVTAMMPGSIVAGSEEVQLVEFSIVYPPCEDCSPAQVDGVKTNLLNTDGVPLDPQKFLDRIGVSVEGEPARYQPYVELVNGAVYFRFGETGLQLSAEDSIRVRLVADIEALAPHDSLVLVVESSDRLVLSDLADPAHDLRVVANPACDLSFPMAIGPAAIIQPAGRPSLSAEDHSVIIVHQGQFGVPLMELNVDYSLLGQQGDVELQGLSGQVFTRTAAGFIPTDLTDLVSSVSVWLDESPVATFPVAADQPLTFALAEPVVLTAGASHQLRLTGDIKSTATPANYSFAFMDSLSLTLQDPLLHTAVLPLVAEGTYPLRGTELSVTAATIAASFTNYPNPFNAADGNGTTITYMLAEPAHVSISLYTITGDLVTDLAVDEYRETGQHQADKWYGENQKGREVLPGTYLCRLTIRYLSGGEESLQRKVAVIR